MVGGWQRKAWLRPKMEEAAPRQPSLVNKSSAKKQAVRFAGVHPCKHSHRGAEACTASTGAKTLSHTHHPHHPHHPHHSHHSHHLHHTLFSFFFFLLLVFSYYYIFYYFLFIIYVFYLLFFFNFFFKKIYIFLIYFIYIKKGNGLLKGVVEAGVRVSGNFKMRVCNNCCCGPCTGGWTPLTALSETGAAVEAPYVTHLHVPPGTRFRSGGTSQPRVGRSIRARALSQTTELQSKHSPPNPQRYIPSEF